MRSLRALPGERSGTAALAMSKSLEIPKAEGSRSVAELCSCRGKSDRNPVRRKVKVCRHSNNRHPRALGVGLADGFNPENLLSPVRPEGNEQHLIIIVLDNLIQRSTEFLETEIIQRTLENRILKPLAVRLASFRHLPQPLGMANIITDEIAGAGHGDQRVVNG